MIDVDNSEGAAQVIAWLNSHGVTTVTCLLQGSSAYNPYGDGYIPYNVFLDPQFIVRYTNSGYSQGAYDTWAALVEEYGYDPTYPYFENLSWEITDDGNGDGHPDPGENCQMTFTLGNHDGCADAVNVTGELSNDDPDIDITNPNCTFGDIPNGGTATSTTVEFSVNAGADPHQTDFTFTVNADNAADPRVFNFSFGLGRAHWLVVDDDDGENHAEWVVDSFNDLDLYVDVWDGSQPVTAGELSSYDAVVWVTGTAESTLDEDEQAAATEFLQNGGRLLLSSQYLGEDIGDTPFFSDVLHAEHYTDNMLYSWVVGIDGAPFAADMEFLLAGSGDGAANSVSPSSITPLAPAEAFLEYRDQGEYAGTLYNGRDYKVIYLGFAMEAIGGLAGTNTRTEFLEAALTWLDAFQGVTDQSQPILPDRFVMTRAYPNPFNPVTTIEIELVDHAAVELTCFDLLGAEVYSQSLPLLTAGVHSVQFNGADLASGIYFLRLDARRLLDGRHQVEQLKLNLVK